MAGTEQAAPARCREAAPDPTGTAIDQIDVDNEWNQCAQSWDNDPAARPYAAAALGSLTELLRTTGPALEGASVRSSTTTPPPSPSWWRA
jgi:hypothetical protein